MPTKCGRGWGGGGSHRSPPPHSGVPYWRRRLQVRVVWETQHSISEGWEICFRRSGGNFVKRSNAHGEGGEEERWSEGIEAGDEGTTKPFRNLRWSVGSGAGKCNPLLLFLGSGAGKCNPYSCFWALGLESATPIAVLGFWGWRMQPLWLLLKSWDWKMQPLLLFWGLGAGKCNPLLLFWGPGAGKCNPYKCVGVSCVSGV